VIASDNHDDEFVAFDLDGTASQLGFAPGMGALSLTYTTHGLVFGGVGTNSDGGGNILRETIRKVDLQTGNRTTILKLSEAAPMEAIDWANDPSQYRFILRSAEQVTDILFGNAPLSTPPPQDDDVTTNEGTPVNQRAG
jgi:hypothetical protein